MVEDYAKDVSALIAHLGLRDIVLWGNSTGGRVAQVIAGASPDLVEGVIVEDVGPERPETVSNRRAGRMAREEAGWATTEELLAYVKPMYPRTREAILENFVRHGSMRNPEGRIVWKRDPAILKGFVPTELWESVRRIRAPIVYVLGGASAIVPPETQARLREILPQVEIVTMPGLGHYPSDEDPHAFVAIVDRFLAGL
jgi:pimeloyl-ACP methyl ester carboxylesterase